MNTWDERFSGEDYAYGTEPNEFLVAAVHYLPPSGHVLCLAEGEGRNAVWLAKQGHTVTAMDGSPVGLLKAARLAGEAGVSLTAQVADLDGYEIGEACWDAIVVIWVPLSPDLRRSVLQGCVRGLKPGGVLVYEGYGPKQLEYKTGGPPCREMLPSLSELLPELAGLTPLHAIETDRQVLEGRFHTGVSSVVQVVARK